MTHVLCCEYRMCCRHMVPGAVRPREAKAWSLLDMGVACDQAGAWFAGLWAKGPRFKPQALST